MLKTPFRVLKSGKYPGAPPRIVDAEGKPVCSFGNQARYRGNAWAWEAAREITWAVNQRSNATRAEI